MKKRLFSLIIMIIFVFQMGSSVIFADGLETEETDENGNIITDESNENITFEPEDVPEEQEDNSEEVKAILDKKDENISEYGISYMYADESESSYADEIEFVCQLGIMQPDEKGRFMPKEAVSRADMVRIIIKCFDIIPEDSQSKFSDIQGTEDFASYLKSLEVMGIIHGYDDGTFRPNEYITYEGAIRILVSALGYNATPYENLQGDWFATASRIGLLKGIKGLSKEPIARETMAKMMCNASEIDLFQALYDNNKIKYGTVKDETFIKKCMKLTKIEEQVKANYFTNIGVDEVRIKDEVILGNKRYKTGSTNIQEAIGLKVTAYVSDEILTKKEQEIRAFIVNKKCKKPITIASDLIESTTSTQIRYLKSEDSVNSVVCKIKQNADLVYNNTLRMDWTAEDLHPVNGTLKLLDTDADNIYDTVFVKDYKTIITESVNVVEKVIFSAYEPEGDWYEIDLDDEKKDIKVSIVNREGKPVGLGSIKEHNILSVARNDDATVYEIIVSNLKVTASCKQKSSDKVTIGTVEFKLSHSLMNNPALTAPILMENGVFYLDHNGKVAEVSYEGVTGILRYGYVISGNFSTDDDNVYLKILSEDNTVKKYSIEEKVKINKKGVKVHEVIKEEYGLFLSGDVIQQIIKFKSTPTGVITALELAREGGSVFDSNRNNYLTQYDSFGKIKYHSGTIKGFASKYLVRPTTKIFVMPTEKNASDEDYYIVKSTYFESNKDYENVRIYDVDEKFNIGVMSMSNTRVFALKDSSPVGVVSKITKTLNEDDEEVFKFEMYSKGNLFTYYIDNLTVDAVFNKTITNMEEEEHITVDAEGNKVLKEKINLYDLKPGDIFRYEIDPYTEEFSAAEVLYRNNKPSYIEKTSGIVTEINGHTGVFWAYGRVEKRISDKFVFRAPNPQYNLDVSRLQVFGSSNYVYIVDGNKIYVGTKDDIQKGNTVFVHNSYSTVKEVVIYK